MTTAMKRRFIYNCDGGNLYNNQAPLLRPDDLYPYVDEVVDRNITSFFISPNLGMNANLPGAINEMFGTNASPTLAEKIKPGVVTKSGSLERLAANLQSLVDAGHDPLELVLARAKHKQREVFISFRMNEVHNVSDPDSLLFSRFWKGHPEWHIGTPGDKLPDVYLQIIGSTITQRHRELLASWQPGGLNYAIPEVREHRLSQLRECCERYSVDGLDLDFQRAPIYFRPGEEQDHVKTMNAWIREVRQMTQEVSRTRAEPLLLSARVLARPEQNTAIGLDPFAWAAEGLVDFLTIGHFLRNDFLLPVAEFRELLPADLPLYACIEITQEPHEYRTIAKQLWQAGADGLMLFNFFCYRERGKEPPFELLDVLGDPETLLQKGEW